MTKPTSWESDGEILTPERLRGWLRTALTHLRTAEVTTLITLGSLPDNHPARFDVTAKVGRAKDLFDELKQLLPEIGDLL